MSWVLSGLGDVTHLKPLSPHRLEDQGPSCIISPSSEGTEMRPCIALPFVFLVALLGVCAQVNGTDPSPPVLQANNQTLLVRFTYNKNTTDYTVERKDVNETSYVELFLSVAGATNATYEALGAISTMDLVIARMSLTFFDGNFTAEQSVETLKSAIQEQRKGSPRFNDTAHRLGLYELTVDWYWMSNETEPVPLTVTFNYKGSVQSSEVPQLVSGAIHTNKEAIALVDLKPSGKRETGGSITITISDGDLRPSAAEEALQHATAQDFKDSAARQSLTSQITDVSFDAPTTGTPSPSTETTSTTSTETTSSSSSTETPTTSNPLNETTSSTFSTSSNETTSSTFSTSSNETTSSTFSTSSNETTSSTFSTSSNETTSSTFSTSSNETTSSTFSTPSNVTTSSTFSNETSSTSSTAQESTTSTTESTSGETQTSSSEPQPTDSQSEPKSLSSGDITLIILGEPSYDHLTQLISAASLLGVAIIAAGIILFVRHRRERSEWGSAHNMDNPYHSEF
ncbi:hypothetical protein PROFUN_11893 [Planoprotostelium fungivorum]|uniref:Uncharacterized protein n=1 Tax=Planoprotostelium fungivorum TaxID=1890364 RepID=A0A2P6N8Z4_9EUKA|nr:hypothetical protein PROFUN_11893 [Planoprotostelium fungivorum]